MGWRGVRAVGISKVLYLPDRRRESAEHTMHTAEALKAEITSELNRLPLASLRTLADFVAFLGSKSRQEDVDASRDEREAVERYAAAYREHPETDEEVAVTYAMSQEALAGEPWE
jgi:hypothetical protein